MSDAFDPRFEIARLGARWDPEILRQTRNLFRPLVSALGYGTSQGPRDIPYGDHPRNRLDLFLPELTRAPVVLFLHGGGFVGGDKAGDPLFYANVGHYLAAHGYLGVTANYRLAPEQEWPAGSDDVSAIIEWLVQHAASYGGDPDRIVIIGQSAGAAHAAGYLFHPRYQGHGRKRLKAAALMSGFYRAAAPLEGGPKLYFGTDEHQWSYRSPISHLASDHLPLLLSIAEFDPGPIAAQTLDLAAALNACDGQPPPLHWFEGHNHVSTVHGLGIGQDAVGQALLNFIATFVR